MKLVRYPRTMATAALALVCATATFSNEVRHLKLEEAVRMALEQNRVLKIARFKVKESEERKAGARSDYFPTITNQSNALHISELQNVVISAGALGNPSGVLIPSGNINLQQGKQTLLSSGTMITQPLTQLLRVRQANRAATAEIAASKDELKSAENEIALKTHALYFGILIAQLQKKAAEQETAFASESLREKEDDIRGGSALPVAEIQSRAELLEGKQSVLTADLQIQDYMTELNDLLGLPLDTRLELDTDIAADFPKLTKAEYIKAAWEENPEIRAAQQVVEKARAGVSASKTAYIPDITAFARHSYQDGVPFLVRNFGTFGINLNYTLWDFGKRRAAVRERSTQLAEAEENLERLREQVAVEVERSYNKMERTKNMVEVATQVAKLRQESERLTTDQASQGVLLVSDVRHAGGSKLQGQSGSAASESRLPTGARRARTHCGSCAGIGGTMKHQLRARTRYALWIFAGLASLLGGPAGQGQSVEPFKFFREYVGLKDEQISAIRNGKAIAKIVESRTPDEVFVFGAVYVESTPEKYLKFASDIDSLRKLPNYLAIQKFSNPPKLSDLEGFSLEAEDIKDLKNCEPGHCDVQLPGEAMDSFKRSIDWTAPDVANRVNQLARTMALDALLKYVQGGNAALGTYRDKKHPAVVAETFQSLLSRSKALPVYLPQLDRYLLDYPNATSDKIQTEFFWEKVNFGLKPTLRIVQAIVFRDTSSEQQTSALAVKQLYSSHYFETALDLTVCVKDSERPGIYLITMKGSQQAGLTGFKGGIVRKVAVDKTRSSLEKALAAIKQKLESHKD